MAKQLVKKAENLKDLVGSFSQSLPKDKVNDLRYHLKSCLNDLPQNIESGLTTERKIDRIKSLIKANGELNQCRDYLQLLSRMRIAQPDDILVEIEDLTSIINSPEVMIRNQHSLVG